MAGSEIFAMRWTVFTTLCSATEQFPDQTVIRLVRMLSIAKDGSRELVLSQCSQGEEALLGLLDQAGGVH